MRKVAVAIAVENYIDNRIPKVEFASADATEFFRALQQHGFDPGDGLLLIDNAATKSALQSKLRKLIQGLQPDDTLYLFFEGHGFAHNGRNFITCHDTQIDDLTRTSIPVEWLFEQFKKSKCRKIAVFLDSCEAGFLATSKVRGIYTDLTEDQLKEFFQEAEHRICFAACKPGQVSRSHASLKHGVWTHHVIEALDGNALLALEGNRLTAISLQNFLKAEVPRSIRNLFTGTDAQTPWFYGAASSDFLVADLDPILAKRSVAANPTRQQVKHVRLLNSENIPVRRLSGFLKKAHHVPDRVSTTTESFVEMIATKDVEQEIDALHDRLRRVFKFKRTDIKATADGGSGSIVTPYFDYVVSVSLNPDDPSEVIFRRQIRDIREPEQIFTDEFDDVFEGSFDRLQFATGDRIDLGAIVDHIESLESDEIDVSYDAALTRCSIDVAGSNVSIEVTPNAFIITHRGRVAPRVLIQSFFDCQKLLVDTHELKSLPFQVSSKES